MLAFALLGLEKAINQYLRLDAESTTRLAKLKGKLIQIEIIDWRIQFFVQATHDGLQLLTEPPTKPDTTIKGNLFDLMRAGYLGADSRSLFKNTIGISGDTDTGEALRDVMQKIDIDWEEHLSRITGDSIAHKLSFQFKQIVHFGEESLNRLQDNIKEFIHFEAAYFPTCKQIEMFYQNVNRLRDDVDRLAARIARLEKSHKKRASND